MQKSENIFGLADAEARGPAKIGQPAAVRPPSFPLKPRGLLQQALAKRIISCQNLANFLACCARGRAHSVTSPTGTTVHTHFIRIPKPGAAPRPFTRERRQLCLRRIVFDVAPRFRLVLAVTHVRIPIALLPKLSLASENLIGL